MSSFDPAAIAVPIEALGFWAERDELRGLVHLTPDGRIASWNAGAARIAGYSAAQALGRKWTTFAALPDVGVERIHPLVRQDGTSVSVRLLMSPLRRDGECIGFGLILRDLDPAVASAASAADELEERYRACVDHAADALFIHRNGVVVDVNRAACESLGYSREELLGTKPSQFDPDVTRAQLAEMGKRLSAGETVAFDSHHRRKDGSLFPVEIRIRMFLSGGVPFGLSLARDITARERVEEDFRASEARYVATLAALRESEERFEFALRGANDGIWDWNLLTDEVVFSTRWKSMLGYTAGELSNDVSTWRTLLHPDDRAPAEERVRQFLASEIDKYEIEFRMAHKQGGYRAILSRGHLVWDDQGRPVRFVGTHVDITERKQAELALRKSEEMLRRAQAIAHVVSWSCDLSTGNTTTSDEGRTTPAVDLLKDVHPEDMARVQAAWRATCEGAPLDIEHRHIVQGEVRWVYVRATADTDEQGRPTTIIGVTQDITARRSLEDNLRQAQKMEAVGQLAGGIAHDFNNLLTVINCTTDLVLDEVPPGSLHDDIAEVRSAGARAADLTRQLLAFSRKQILQPRVLDLNATLSQAQKLLRRLIGEDIGIVSVLEPALARIHADPGQLEQVLLNLAVNARDAMPTGGTLTIETKNTVVGREVDKLHGELAPGPYVQLTVTDTGGGVPDDLKVKIFEPFFSTKGVGKGTGLGLATVYGIVKQSGGDISVTSRVGVGTTFTLLFPSVDPLPASTSATQAQPTTYGGTETVLLVEDEDAVRRIARMALEKQGYTVLEASLGSLALDLALGHLGEIHLLLTDVVMPGMSGRQLADLMRERTPHLKVLFMSGYTDDSIVRHGVLAAKDHFLAKPFTPLSLVRMVRQALDSSVRGP